jgi:outer membrane protein
VKKQNWVLIISLVLGAAALVLALRVSNPFSRTAYVDLAKVYAAFSLKKELEGKLEQVQQIRKMQLDSLELNLNVLSKNLQSPKVENRKGLEEQFSAKRQQYAFNKQRMEEESNNLTQAYDEQIWKQLNQYVKEYGKEKGYTYIFGAEGSGALMYADDAVNVTETMITYVNQRYKGQNPGK